MNDNDGFRVAKVFFLAAALSLLLALACDVAGVPAR